MQVDLETSISAVVFLGALTPFLTAILTRFRDPDWFKGLVSMTAAVGLGVLASIEQNGGVVAEDTLQNAGAVWLIHLMTYFGVTKDMVGRLSKATVKFAPVALKRSSTFTL